MSLARALVDLANEAPDYSNADAAVRRARWRTRAAIASASAGVLAIVLTLVVIVPGLLRGPGLPPDIDVPTSAPPLPTTHGVGAASLLYAPCLFPYSGSPCQTFLVMP